MIPGLFKKLIWFQGGSKEFSGSRTVLKDYCGSRTVLKDYSCSRKVLKDYFGSRTVLINGYSGHIAVLRDC